VAISNKPIMKGASVEEALALLVLG
jgi:hypothetical protein